MLTTDDIVGLSVGEIAVHIRANSITTIISVVSYSEPSFGSTRFINLPSAFKAMA
ncbi:hypothetical protein HanXRQr2_Chr11g0475341 [Helianthus annuus]|uniref:Uncharacterized protein n=1 Tax=Helianthus annuus TaxID=4232 RepID=A0A9K3HM45_HELAN|nr:hypothetical protein HanXRQr2_Chr11g0475341 [Helianthus annuus]